MARYRHPKVVEFLERAIIYCFGAALGLMIFGLKQGDQLTWASRHSSVVGRIISAEHISQYRNSHWQIVVRYRPYPSVSITCQVSVRLPYDETGLYVGEDIPVVPRRIACYQPVLPTHVGSMTTTIVADIVFLAGGIASVIAWSKLRKSTLPTLNTPST